MSKWKRREPETIEAFQWTGGPDQVEDPAWIVDAIREGNVVFRENLDERCVEMCVTNPLGLREYVKPGDWVVKAQVDGRFLIVFDEVFRAKYEPAE